MGFFSSIGGFLKDTAGSIISAGSNLVGGLLGNSSASSINQSNQNFAREQFEYQKALHQNQLQWRVEDAKKAGLHPLAGIGVQAPSFSPVSASTTPLDYSWIGDLGQSANYGATKAKSSKDQETMIGLQIRGMELDNEYKQAQIDQMKVDTLASSIASNQALRSPSAPSVNATSPVNTGLRSPEGSAYHVWDMGDGNFDILMNPDYQQTIGDEFGQVATTLKAITRAKQGVWINPEDGRSYVYNPHTGYFNLLSALSDEEASRMLGNRPVSVGSAGSHYERNRYRYRY